MRVGLYTTSVSPHQLPLARELGKRVGSKNFWYVYTEIISEERKALGWSGVAEDVPFRVVNINEPDAQAWVRECELLFVDLRDAGTIEQRLSRGLKTYYVSERWWKPIPVFPGFMMVGGWVRMLVPDYYRMCKRVAKFFNDPNFRYLAVGPWAMKDMMAICRWFTGKSCEEKMVPWGYFVAPSEDAGIGDRGLGIRDDVLRVLWVGRMVKLKLVETIVRAIRRLCEGGRRVELTLVGDGPERKNLLQLAQHLPVRFAGKRSAAEVREVIRQNDVLVFSSNGMDGWGAVVNEALEEGVAVVGTYETGACAALLPKSNLYHCGNVNGLVKCLERFVRIDMPYDYTAKGAAERIMAI